MEASNKYRKESESYVPFLVHHNKKNKYPLPHARFVVPWQMEDVIPVKEKDRS